MGANGSRRTRRLDQRRTACGTARGGARHASATGFDFTARMRRLCADMVRRVEPLHHVHLEQVAISFTQVRKAVDHGMYASLTPMRFAGGKPHTVARGRKWTVQRLYDRQGREMLYILNFYLPRFLDLSLREKFNTVMHELWHIGPRFDGDSRRFNGRCHAHGSSQKRYDAHVSRLVDTYLAAAPPEPVWGFLRLSFGELRERFGRVYGEKIPPPKLVAVD